MEEKTTLLLRKKYGYMFYFGPEDNFPTLYRIPRPYLNASSSSSSSSSSLGMILKFRILFRKWFFFFVFEKKVFLILF